MSIEAQLIYDIIKIFSLENFMYVFVIFEIKGMFGRALAHLKMAPALAPLKEQLLWRS